MFSFLDSPLVCPVVIGRAKYLAALDNYLKASAAGKGHTLLLKGEAGVGKSRLVAEALARAAQAGLQSGLGQCFEHQPTLPFAPLLEILRDLLASPGAAQVKRLLDAGGLQALSRLLPELLPPGTEAGPPASSDPEQEKHLIFNTLVQFFSRLAAQQPLLLVCEDLHWCDETSLEFLLQLARRIASQPILVLLTYRSDEISPALGHFLAELDRARLAAEITLYPFSPVETGQMLQKILEQPQPVRNDFLNPIYDMTEGNPFLSKKCCVRLSPAASYTGQTIAGSANRAATCIFRAVSRTPFSAGRSTCPDRPAKYCTWRRPPAGGLISGFCCKPAATTSKT